MLESVRLREDKSLLSDSFRQVFGFNHDRFVTHNHPDPAKTFLVFLSCSLFWIVWAAVLQVPNGNENDR